MHKREDLKIVTSIFSNKQRNYEHKVAESVELELRIPSLKILYGISFVFKAAMSV